MAWVEESMIYVQNQWKQFYLLISAETRKPKQEMEKKWNNIFILRTPYWLRYVNRAQFTISSRSKTDAEDDC